MFALLICAHPASAAEMWSGEIALTSDYVYRGQSFSDGNPALQASAGWTNAGAANLAGLHADLWLSSVDFGPGDPTDAETSFTLGYGTEAGALRLDAGATYIVYLDAPAGGKYSYMELYGAAATEIAAGELTAAVHYSPRYSGDTGPALFADLEASWPLVGSLSAAGGVGYAHLDPRAGADYVYWQAGLNLDAAGLTFALRYHGHNQSGCVDLCADRVAVTIAKAF